MKFFSTAILALVAAADPKYPYCEFPEVMQCYKAPKDKCWTDFEAANKDALAALNDLPDSNVSTKIKGFLESGDDFKKVWTINTEGDDVYLTAYAFEKIGFKEDIQIHEANLQVMAMSGDQHYMMAAQKLYSEFDNTFYQECISPANMYAGKNDTMTAAEPLFLTE